MTQKAVLTYGPEKRYAKALVALAAQRNGLETLADEAALLRDVLNNVPEVQIFFKSPFVNHHQKTEALIEVLKKIKVSDLMQQFVTVVGEHQRLDLLEGMLWQVQRLIDARQNRVCAAVESAVKLSDAQRKSIAKYVQNLRKDATEVVLEEKVDNRLLGGVRVTVGSQQVDATVRGQLDRLKTSLVK